MLQNLVSEIGNTACNLDTVSLVKHCLNNSFGVWICHGPNTFFDRIVASGRVKLAPDDTGQEDQARSAISIHRLTGKRWA